MNLHIIWQKSHRLTDLAILFINQQKEFFEYQVFLYTVIQINFVLFTVFVVDKFDRMHLTSVNLKKNMDKSILMREPMLQFKKKNNSAKYLPTARPIVAMEAPTRILRNQCSDPTCS